jgi:hypothetical protein
MAWVTSRLNIELEDNDNTKKIVDRLVLVGDCAYVTNGFMATPLKGIQGGSKDAYNFYLLQLRITIERALGVLIHWWAVLHAPLLCPMPKVASMIESLIRLHNFWINHSKMSIVEAPKGNMNNLIGHVLATCNIEGGGKDSEVVAIDNQGCPVSLLGHGHHSDDVDILRKRVRKERIPMDNLLQMVNNKGLTRPK